MGIRDEEIKRVKKYAEGLGIAVYFKPFVKGCGFAEWDIDDRSITVFKSPNVSKTLIILLLLHEIGHHLDWIYNHKRLEAHDLKAAELLCDGPIYGDRTDIPKKYRKIIYESEKAGIEFMEIIWKELDLKIPLWKVKMKQDLDLYDYKMLYEKGRFSTYREYDMYKKEIKNYYKNKYGDK